MTQPNFILVHTDSRKTPQWVNISNITSITSNRQGGTDIYTRGGVMVVHEEIDFILIELERLTGNKIEREAEKE